MPNYSPSRTQTYAHATMALTVQYLNVRQRNLGTFIIQTVSILQHESVATDSLCNVHGHSNLLPNNLARLASTVTPLHQ
jgi:hypothetical protein